MKEADFNFDEYFFKKYPELFPKDEAGELLPQHQRCWNDCPEGWLPIVESLFGCIDNYIKRTTRSRPNPKRKFAINCQRKYRNYILNPVCRLLAQRQPITINNTPPKCWRSNICSALHALNLKLFNYNDLYVKENPPAVTIQQYKEKYGTLRIYHDGGDDDVDGMIRYAEFLSSVTCQYTGKPGKLHKRGGWYITLSPSQAKKYGYKVASDT